jgi:hypothetical protein
LPQGSFPAGGPGTSSTIGEYEMEGGKLWREFRDGKLTKEEYEQKMNELRDSIKQKKEEQERAEREANRERDREIGRQRAEEGRARNREMRERHERRKRKQEQEEREERERVEKEKKVSLGEMGTGFQVADNLRGSGSTPNARDLDSNKEPIEHERDHDHRD